MPKAKPELPVADGYERLRRATVEKQQVTIDRTGGRFGAGIIRGVSLAAEGEALGHGLWLDAEMIATVASMSQSETGLKSRFTHPGMSSDGMGRHLGRLHGVKVVGNKAVGDLHFAKSAHDTPDGNLAEYVMTLTEEDPEAAGLSIVFERDMEAERSFQESHQEEYEYTDYSGEKRKGKRFKSPDKNNKKNLRHARVKNMRAADVVDEPAANPDGMFESNSLPREADMLLSYAVGLTKEKPEVTAFGVDADRAAQFLGRWLESHGLSITSQPEETEMAEVSQEEFNEFKKSTNEQLSKVLTAVESLAKSQSDSAAELAAERRKNEILKLCGRFSDRQKGAKLASELIADTSLSLADCKIRIADELFSTAGPISDDNSNADESLSSEKKAERELRKKYEEGRFEELGISWARFQEQEKMYLEAGAFAPVPE